MSNFLVRKRLKVAKLSVKLKYKEFKKRGVIEYVSWKS